MNEPEFRDRLAERAARANISVEPRIIEPLDTYFALLLSWNRAINLTSLSLDPASDQAIDRLFVEPLAAARYLADSSRYPIPKPLPAPSPQPLPWTWFDLGSGGGSPAIPMKIALPALKLTMIESKSRKVAFLREVVRRLVLSEVDVVNARFDEVSEAAGRARLITVRAVRLDAHFAAAAGRLLESDGVLAAFQPTAEPSQLSGFESPERFPLLPVDHPSWLHLYRHVPRGTSAQP